MAVVMEEAANLWEFLKNQAYQVGEVSARMSIYIYFFYTWYIQFTYMPYMYAKYLCTYTWFKGSYNQIKLSLEFRVDYDYSLKGNYLKVLWFFSMFSKWERYFWSKH